MNAKLEQQAEILFQNIQGWELSTLERIGKRIDKIGKMSIADIQDIPIKNNVVLKAMLIIE